MKRIFLEITVLSILIIMCGSEDALAHRVAEKIPLSDNPVEISN